MKDFYRLCILATCSLALQHTALAQTAAPLKLSCPAPGSQGVTANLSTRTAPWTISIAGATPTLAAPYQFSSPPWITDIWVGGLFGGSPVVYAVQVDSSDPNLDLTTATLSYSYAVDDTVQDNLVNNEKGVTWNSTALPFDPNINFRGSSATYNVSVPLTGVTDTLTFRTFNNSQPTGLAAKATLTFNCVPGGKKPAPVPVPTDAPWILLGLGLLLTAGAALSMRRL